MEWYKIPYILDIHIIIDNKNDISLSKHYSDIHSENNINIIHQDSPNKIWTLNYIKVHQKMVNNNGQINDNKWCQISPEFSKQKHPCSRN